MKVERDGRGKRWKRYSSCGTLVKAETTFFNLNNIFHLLLKYGIRRCYTTRDLLHKDDL